MSDDRIDVNSELYFNEKLHLWLSRLAADDVRLVLRECFQVDLTGVQSKPTICPWDQIDPAYGNSSRFDQKIDFSKECTVILELKISTEATVGQLKKYLEYVDKAGYAGGYVILLSRNELASRKLGYGDLRESYPNLLFITWNQFETSLKVLAKNGDLKSPKQPTEHFLYLLSFLTDIRKRSQRLVVQPPPPSFDIEGHLNTLRPASPPKKKGPFLVWQDRDEFWNDLLHYLCNHAGLGQFVSFRFDFYDYIVRWAFHVKRVYLDIYEDKNYEYMYSHFIEHIYPHRQGLPSALLSELYYRFLLIREDEVLTTRNHRLFFRRFGKTWYFYAMNLKQEGSDVPYLECHALEFSIP